MTPETEDLRLAELRGWLDSLAGATATPTVPPLRPETLRPASDDASFRRYFRIDCGGGPDDAAKRGGSSPAASVIAMDAPPPMEDCRPFVAAARVFGDGGVKVPTVLAADLDRGFLLLDDFGSTTYLSQLGTPRADALYRDALGALVTLQAASRPGVFPDYDEALLRRELELYPDWYVARHRGVTLSEAERARLSAVFERLLANNLAQPRVFVHRDYHSRNLMVLPGSDNPGVLDFQDAVYGPITYDLVSLLRDAYVDWPEARQIDWAARYWDAARRRGLPVDVDFSLFYRDFEWMGLQRHLKVLGIFARLYHRDGKDRYLGDMPRVLAYVLQVTRRYGEFDALTRLIERIERQPAQTGYTF
ncbi:MAG: aminoglycoside phosphotransferase family protein [Burkholderiaceae bacterium]